ncbi:putative ATP-dependent RNA helicase ddx4 [Globodera pallida]|nr:putative ATP-dependent RNA helicase ddx4 [Globodera pallida]
MASREELAKFTVVQLRHQLKAKKLPVAGVKAALINRLIEDEEESTPATKKHLPTMATHPTNEPVHISRECPQEGGGGEGINVCSNCKEPGHFSRDCPQIGDGGDGEDDDIVCSNCNGLGHFSCECPFAGGGGGHGGSHTDNVCSNCNEPGCFSRECLQGRGAVVGGIQMDTRGRARASRVAARQQSTSTLPRTTTTTSTVATVVVPPPSTTTAASADATVPTSSSSSTTASSKKALKRQRNHNNKKKEKLLVMVPKGKTPSHVTHDPGLPEDNFEVSKVLASSAYNGERLYYLEWKR